jgi:hypothetical protein
MMPMKALFSATTKKAKKTKPTHAGLVDLHLGAAVR